MADTVSDSDVPKSKPPPKRRRILDPSAIVPVPVYSSKVSTSLQLKPRAVIFTKQETTDDSDHILWTQFSSRGRSQTHSVLSDSEDEEADYRKKKTEAEAVRSPSPPPPQSPVQKQSRRVKKTISAVDQRLQALNSLLTPDPRCRRTRSSQARPPPDDDDVIIISPNNDDITVTNPNDDDVIQEFQDDSLDHEIPLKIRCRADVHKIPVLSSTPLGDVVTQLSVILNVPPPCLLLLRGEAELPTNSTVGELGLGIADIIECFVMAAEDKSDAATGSSIINLRLQSKERNTSQEFSLQRDAALGSIFSQYLSNMSVPAQRAARFHFDGSKVTHSQTPAQLDMEDGDIIEVWI